MDKSYQICKEMFLQRNYIILNEMDDQIKATKSDGQTVYAFFSHTPKFNVESIQEYITIMNNLKIKHGIIIFKDTITPIAKKIVKNIIDMSIELFNSKDMQYNITKHRLVPIHVSLPLKESEEFKTTYGTQIPKILTTDPISKFYAFKQGEIIKITRKNGVIAYRIVS